MPALSMIFILAASLSVGGVVTVVTEPGAQVVWEGVVLGRADERGRMEIQDIPFGSYSLTVSKPGFSTLKKRVEVRAGGQTASFPLSPLSTGISQKVPAEPPPKKMGLSSIEAPPAPTTRGEPSENHAESANAEEVRKSSQIHQSQSAGAPRIWYVLVAAVMAAVLIRFLRRPSGIVSPPEPQRPPFLRPEPSGQDSGETPTSASAAFLDDLRRREAMAEKGVVALSRDVEETAIELDKTAVRIVEE